LMAFFRENVHENALLVNISIQYYCQRKSA
jgi:hypothetical protein